MCVVLPCQLAQSHHFFVGNIADVNLERNEIKSHIIREKDSIFNIFKANLTFINKP